MSSFRGVSLLQLFPNVTDKTDFLHRLLQIFNFWAAASAAFLVDRLGRRTLFIWSGLGMLISFVIWTACSAVFDTQGRKGAGIAVVAFIFIYVSLTLYIYEGFLILCCSLLLTLCSFFFSFSTTISATRPSFSVTAQRSCLIHFARRVSQQKCCRSTDLL